MTEDTLLPFDLPAVRRKKVTADFDGGLISSDGGVVLLREAERRLGLAETLAGCIRDWRDPSLVVHTLPAMLRFRMFAIACGYEDADDCDALRTDPLFKLAVGRAPESGRALCSQPTMSRLENAPSRIEVARMTAALVDIFCEQPVTWVTLWTGYMGDSVFGLFLFRDARPGRPETDQFPGLAVEQSEVDAGGAAISSYEYRYAAGVSVPADTGWTSAGTALTATVSGLNNGTQYAFEVRAVNGVGNNLAVGTAATPATLPDAPQNLAAAFYRRAPRVWREPGEPVYDAGHAVRRVRRNGCIKWGGEEVFVSEALAGESVGIAETEDGAWIVRFAGIDLGLFDRQSRKLRRFPSARPGRREQKRTENTVIHVTGP